MKISQTRWTPDNETSDSDSNSGSDSDSSSSSPPSSPTETHDENSRTHDQPKDQRKTYKEILTTPNLQPRAAYTEARDKGFTQAPTQGTNPRSQTQTQYKETTTLEIWSRDGKSHKMEEVLDEIDSLDFDTNNKMKGIQEIDRRLGKFKITFKTNQDMRKIKEDWLNKARNGESIITPIGKKDDVEEEPNSFTLQGVPMEYPLEMVNEYMKKYVCRGTLHHQRSNPSETPAIQWRSTRQTWRSQNKNWKPNMGRPGDFGMGQGPNP